MASERPIRSRDLEDPEYFSDKIKIYEAFYGKTQTTKMYWTLSVIRNHLSHGRINELKYKGRSLEERDAKEEILTDYLEAMLFDDKTQSTWWGMLSEKEREDIVKQSNEMIDEMKPTD